MDPKVCTVEKVVYWFFRLNGCLTIENFIIHPDYRGSQRTDADLLAVRFPYRQELNMKDHILFDSEKKRIAIFIVEIKRGICNLNGPWINKENENINRVLKSIGAFSIEKVNAVAMNLYEKAKYEDENFVVQLVAVGCKINNDLKQKYKNLQQLTYKKDVFSFIYDRLKNYKDQKADHSQWDNCGRALYELMQKSSSDEFVNKLINNLFK